MTKYTRAKFDDEHKKKVESYKVATCGSEVEPLLEWQVDLKLYPKQQ